MRVLYSKTKYKEAKIFVTIYYQKCVKYLLYINLILIYIGLFAETNPIKGAQLIRSVLYRSVVFCVVTTQNNTLNSLTSSPMGVSIWTPHVLPLQSLHMRVLTGFELEN